MIRFRRFLPQLAIAAALCGVAAEPVSAKEAVIPKTVYIGDIDVSGMTKEEAQDAIDDYEESLEATQFTLTTGDKSITVSAGDLGLEVDSEQVVEEALNIGKTGNLIARYKAKKDLAKEKKVFELDFRAEKTKLETLLEVNLDNLNQEAVDSGLKRENDKFQIVDGANGITVNVSDSVDAVEEYLKEEFTGTDSTITLVTQVEKPKGTREELEKVTDVLGTYHTDFSSSAAGRAKNVKVGCEKINGSVIYPGEQFSVYEVVNPFTKEEGYELAGSYENGTTVQSYGGGICQVSTTLYNAVILAELQIDERFNHSMIVNYVKPSMDAAIAGTWKDLKFSNNTDAPIYIEGYTSNGNLYFSIYGDETRDANRKVSYVSETTGQTNPGVSLQGNGGYPVGYVATTQSPHTGYTAKLWKVVTVNGVEESRTEFNTSRYNASNKILTVGVATENPEAAAQIAAAIASGDEATVRAIAAQYSGATAPAAPEAPPAATPEVAPVTAPEEEKKEETKKEENKEEEKKEEKKEESKEEVKEEKPKEEEQPKEEAQLSDDGGSDDSGD